MNDLVQYLDAVTEARTVEEVWSLHTDAMSKFGFDRLIYGFTPFLTRSSFGDMDDMLILSNHDAPYVERFVNEKMYLHAPMVRWAADNTGACSWHWIAQNYEQFTDRERNVIHFNRQSGVTAGYSISFRDTSVRSKGAIALTARRGISQDEVEAVWETSGRMIEVMNRLAHLKIINLPHSGKRRLTRRQREALEWVGDGKTMQDIACIMGLTTATVEKHLRLAREALNVETTAQAVLKASIQNQIFLVPQL